MWDQLFERPRGRLSTRNLFTAATAFVLALFAALLITTPAFAAPDATWNDSEEIVYQGNTYRPTDDQPVPAVPSEAETIYVHQSGDTDFSFIYFVRDVDHTTAESAQYVDATYNSTTNRYIADGDARTITLAQLSDAPPADGREGTTCNIDNIGWIICPVTEYLAKGIDTLYSFLSTFLNVSPLLDGNNSLYRLWEVMRNFANIAFVIAFMIIIYTQLIGGGLSNYNLKRMLPRLVIAAILVNVSYWLCALAVDISNILGYSIQNLFIGLRDYANVDENRNVGWGEVTAFVLSGGTIGGLAFLTAAGGSVASAAFFLSIAVISALFSILVAVIILAARQALITVLVVIAPLAFVAYILPGTEKWFDRWKDSLLTLLMMFPIFSMIFGGSQLAGQAIIQNADNIVIVVLGLAVMVTPLIITPLLIKLSSGMLGQIANVVNNKEKGFVDGSKNFMRNRGEHYKDKALGSSPRSRFSSRRLAQRMDNRKRDDEARRKNYQSAADQRYTRSAGYRRNQLRTRDLEDGTKNLQAGVENEYLGSGAYRTHHTAAHDLDIAKKTIEAGHDIHLNARIDPENVHFNRGALNSEMNLRATSDTSEALKQKVESMYSEIKTGHDPTMDVGTHGPSDEGMTHAIYTARTASQALALESMRKHSAERTLDNQKTDTLLKGNEYISAEAARLYAGGIRGSEGAESALTNAIASDRQEYIKGVGEKAELMKHFNIGSAQYQDLALGRAVTAEHEGTVYTFNPSDDYTREAAIGNQLKAGSEGQKIDIIKESGLIRNDAGEVTGEGATYKYRTSISSDIVSSGVANKSLIFGSKTIDKVRGGEVYGEKGLYDAALYHIMEGKISDEVLAAQGSQTLGYLFRAKDHYKETPTYREASDAKKADIERKFNENYAKLRYSAHDILADQVNRRYSAEAGKVFEQWKVRRPTDQAPPTQDASGHQDE